MAVNGIIAEYNPFHNGHKYQLEESRHLTGADYTIVVMSGNFVQRGAPALADKRLRAEMALRCGADLVLELPVLYAAASSEFFAAGAVALLDRLGVVTHLAFGSECGDVDALKQIAAFLIREPEAYRTALKRFLKQGLSYPDAREKALSVQFPPARDKTGTLANQIPLSKNRCSSPNPGESSLPENCGEILASPNNILGIDYIKSILNRKSSILPVTVKRKGAGYHDLLPAANTQASALALRQALYRGREPGQLQSFMPEEALALLTSYLAENRAVFPNDISGILYYRLLLEKESGYEKYLDVSPDLSNRIQNRLRQFTGFTAFCDLLKTRELTYTRISRSLLHILLGIEKGTMALGRELDDAPYARVLGFRRSAAPLLSAVKSHSSIPLITKLAGAKKSLPEKAGRLLSLDILSSEIYKGIAFGAVGRPVPNEFSEPLVIL